MISPSRAITDICVAYVRLLAHMFHCKDEA